MTNAGAKELGGRETGLNEEMLGTLHSVCYQALGCPPIAEKGRLLKQWNENHPLRAISGESSDDDVVQVCETEGDKLFAEISVNRHRMIPVSDWGDEARSFHQEWESYKRDTGSIDFCDMIANAVSTVPQAPHSPRVIFGDEAQDFSRLELHLLKKWAEHTDHLTLIYDPAQALYGWRGSDEGMSSVEPSMVLGQSYRVPALVQERALAVMRQSSTYREAEYRPRAEAGTVQHVGWQLMKPKTEWVDQLDDPFDGPTMVIASCGYMLNPLIKEMRKLGIAYHNPFAPKRWRPLHLGGSTKVTAVDRLLTFAERSSKPCFELRSMRVLCESVYRDMLQPGWEVVLKSLEERLQHVGDLGFKGDRDAIMAAAHAENRVLGARLQEALEEGDIDFYVNAALKKTYRDAVEYPLAVIRRGGAQLLREVCTSDRPVAGAVTVGTIHSVKGGEAARVVLAPDLSWRGTQSSRIPGWHRRDAVIRMFYVGMTRAKNALVITHHTHPDMKFEI